MQLADRLIVIDRGRIVADSRREPIPEEEVLPMMAT